ncbi:MAG: YkgJ family cysteine cluster protein [bacterium]|nr:YkgJ family cysteine cluster protein [bacterium]
MRRNPAREFTRPPLSDSNEALAALHRLHGDVDRRAEALRAEHADRLQCARGCASCCIDGLSVSQIEAEGIRRGHPALLAEANPHSEGACAFLSEDDSCRIYPNRPYVCRTQGLPLRWLDEDQDQEIREHRDICELNLAGPPLTGLRPEACWLLGPTELAIDRIEQSWRPGPQLRVLLRDLFA